MSKKKRDIQIIFSLLRDQVRVNHKIKVRLDRIEEILGIKKLKEEKSKRPWGML